jgi:hypothetical protein
MKPFHAVLLSLAISLAGAPGAWAAGASAAPSITAVRAQLFYDGTGKLSDDVLTMKDLSLWNTIIGEGSAGGASNATLITVEVSGRNVEVGAVAVEIVATGKKRRVLGRTRMEVALYDAKTKFHAPLMLTNTGCEEITITARLVGKGAPKTPATRVIPFQCGE